MASCPGHLVFASDSLMTATCGASGPSLGFEEPPADERDAHRGEVVFARDAVLRHAEAGLGRVAELSDLVEARELVGPRHLDEAAVGEEAAAEWKRADEADAFGARQLRQLRQHVALAVDAPLPRQRVARERPDEIEDERVGRAVAGIDRQHLHEAARQQPRPDEQHHRQRHLRHDESLPCALAAAAAHRALSFPERLAQLGG